MPTIGFSSSADRLKLSAVAVLVLAALSAGPVDSLRGDEAEQAKKLERWKEQYEADVKPIVEARCISCHGEKEPEGELNLTKFLSGDAAVADMDLWDRVAKRIRLNEMPPQGSPQLNDPQKAAFNRWLDSKPNQRLCDQLASDETQSWYRGHVMSRRLTRTEYNNAIRDLLGVDLRPADDFPSDGAGGEGFDTTGDSLFTSAIHLEKYLAAADAAIERVLPDNATGQPPEVVAAREKLLAPASGEMPNEREAARRIVQSMTYRAWRRPVEDAEVERLLMLYDLSRKRGMEFIAAVREPLKAVLVSPHFLFVVESEPEEAGVQRLTPYQLAFRLSLFLWSSIPDDTLLELAASGALYDNDVTREQVRRMLQDPRSRALGENFGLQWLNLGALGSSVRPDPKAFSEFDDTLSDAMREEVIRFLASVFQEDRSLLEILDARYTFANGRLAKHYGIDLPESADWTRVDIQEGPRGGVLTMAGVLTATSYPLRTSPVLRGRWVSEEILGSKVPPPPPNVPALEETPAGQDGKELSLKERLELHRAKPECASCHARMDPLGFGLENFDAIGRWRDAESGHPIEAQGKLPSGETFEGPQGLKKVLLKRRNEFVKHLTRKMLGFALGRNLNKFDQCIVDETLQKLGADGYRSSILIEEIALSYPFQYRYFKKAK